MLSDVSKFKEITVEPGNEINLLLQHEGKLIEFLKQIKSSVTTDLYKHLYPQGSQPGIMYGLSKIHKPLVNGFPRLRPILSAINTGTYKWAIFLCHHETTWLKNCPKAFKPVYYKRYVDDIFVLFEKPEQVSRFVNYMNKRHKNIKFLFETFFSRC